MYHAVSRIGLINTLPEIIITNGKSNLEISTGMTAVRFGDEFCPSLRRDSSK